MSVKDEDLRTEQKSGFKPIECEHDFDTEYYPDTCDGMVIIELRCQLCDCTTTVYHHLDDDVEGEICEDCQFPEEDCTCLPICVECGEETDNDGEGGFYCLVCDIEEDEEE